MSSGDIVCLCLVTRISANNCPCTISRSEQAPGSVFHPRDENGKLDFDFLGPFWSNIKVDPER